MMDSMNTYVSHPQLGPQMNPAYGNWIHPLQFQKPNPSFWGYEAATSWVQKIVASQGSQLGGQKHRGVLKPKNVVFKFNKHPWKNMTDSGNNTMAAPSAPRNTTSFLIRSKGRRCGIAPLVTPSPQTPAVYPTPKFSPLPDALMNKAEEEWGVNGYGSMNGLIRLRAQGHEPAIEMQVDKEDVREIESSESDVEEHVEMEKRVDQDLSRFEMVVNPLSVMNKMDDQDTHVAKLQEENSILKKRVLMMEREMEELSAKMHLFATKENGNKHD